MRGPGRSRMREPTRPKHQTLRERGVRAHRLSADVWPLCRDVLPL
ncbi:hypothetical protein MAR_023670 [Mya arenaria]|uniref:Uncharacterized protein n=1 Tax=Mya arenaria TaxID=6604 RepID=A0ABY7DNN5_MYAAR|nr:hypothetical protein MAR_023670 [Mya arenaria]